MKTRYFILATLAMALLAVSCQKTAVGGAQELEEAPEPIQLTTNLKVNSVSVTKAGVDAWDAAKHTLYIYALPTNEIPAGNDSKILVNNAPAAAPADGTVNPFEKKDITLYADQEASTFYYYPADKTTLDFYGYYVDDAFVADPTQEEAPTKPTPTITSDNISLHLFLDGSQDIMLAKADKIADTEGKEIAPANAYSAYSARKKVKPNLKFEHLLSRFVFRMIAGNPKGAKVQINSISLTSKAEADLLIATTGDTPTGLSNITSADPKSFLLKPVDNETGHEINAFRPKYTSNGDQVDLTIGDQNRIGESIMVIPADEHIMKISMTQLEGEGEDEHGVKDFVYEYHLTPGMVEDTTPDETEPFRAGYKYNVDVVIYGLQEVLVNVTLSKWDEGGTIKIDNDKEWGKEPKLGLKAKKGGSDYYLYFYDELKVGTEVKVWDQTTNKMVSAEAGTYKFDAKQGDYWYVTLIQTEAGDSLKTTVSVLSATDPAATE